MSAGKIKGLRRRGLINSIGIVFLLVAVTIAVVCIFLYRFYFSTMVTQLETRARAVADILYQYNTYDEESFFENTRRYTEDFEDRDKMEFQVLSTSASVKYSSSTALLTGFSPGTPDGKAALEKKETVFHNGPDSRTGERVLSVSTPLYYAGSAEPVGAIRFITGLSNVEREILSTCILALLVGAAVLTIVTLVNLYFLRSIVKPIQQINEMTKKIAAGEYGWTIDLKNDDEIGELANSINYMASEISRSEMLQNDFISSVSHELRTPLTSITGWAETLRQGSGFAEGSTEALGLSVILRESHNLRHMVEELLDFSRIQSGRMAVTRAKFELMPELRYTLLTYEQRIYQDGRQLTFTDETGGDIIVTGDRNRIRQVVLNILDNARKYTGDNGLIHVTAAYSAEAGKVSITIKDNGPGISPDDLPHIKERFYKGKTRQPGSGIGLAVCEEIVSLHNGSLEIDSAPGEGTAVTVTLPAKKKENTQEIEVG